MSDEQILLREDKDGIARLTMNRPGALSAPSDAMIAALGENLAALQADPAIRAIILAGSGKAFCAGHDLRESRPAARPRTRAAPISPISSAAAPHSCCKSAPSSL